MVPYENDIMIWKISLIHGHVKYLAPTSTLLPQDDVSSVYRLQSVGPGFEIKVEGNHHGDQLPVLNYK